MAGTPHLKLVLLALSLLIGSCGSPGGLDLGALEAEPILRFAIPGVADPVTAATQAGERPGVTVLADVTGDWNQVSVEIARAVRAEGWRITAVNCVGTGNDVIAKKQIEETWVLLESGAGTRGAGIILSYDPDQALPAAFAVTGPCPPALVAAASG